METRLSSELALIFHQTNLECPQRSVLEQVRDSLLSSHVLISSDGKLLSCPRDFQPDDVAFYLKKCIGKDPVLSLLPTIGRATYD